ncbi:MULTISPECIES: hypothetical protein [Pseudomonas]|jgi:hypothetical protein|uniref:hypothetical protein n=1 Tax=Pseudomonas TaxID=286 RepID=UPI002093C579|nr:MULTISPECIES: hypothetical protein [Pseudomonas]USS56348.1 hypothetical protein NG836_05375 [Pseudomonas kermanshahensis]UVL67233.1 hypothetical protein LOY53_01665 [Pseudomonas sp. B21-031]
MTDTISVTFGDDAKYTLDADFDKEISSIKAGDTVHIGPNGNVKSYKVTGLQHRITHPDSEDSTVEYKFTHDGNESPRKTIDKRTVRINFEGNVTEYGDNSMAEFFLAHPDQLHYANADCNIKQNFEYTIKNYDDPRYQEMFVNVHLERKST